MINKKYLSAVFCCMLCGMYLLKHNTSSKAKTLNTPQVHFIEPEKIVQPQEVKKSEPVSTVKRVKRGDSLPQKLVMELQPKMESFTQLKNKIFKNSEAQQNWDSLLKNEQTIINAKNLLLAPSLSEEALQNKAIDYLINSMKSGNLIAIQAIEEVISDKLIEGSAVARNIQQFKAEIKAQALYEWSSTNPELESHISSLLPGPTSIRLWNNVKNQQALNVAESETVK